MVRPRPSPVQVMQAPCNALNPWASWPCADASKPASPSFAVASLGLSLLAGCSQNSACLQNGQAQPYCSRERPAPLVLQQTTSIGPTLLQGLCVNTPNPPLLNRSLSNPTSQALPQTTSIGQTLLEGGSVNTPNQPLLKRVLSKGNSEAQSSSAEPPVLKRAQTSGQAHSSSAAPPVLKRALTSGQAQGVHPPVLQRALTIANGQFPASRTAALPVEASLCMGGAKSSTALPSEARPAIRLPIPVRAPHDAGAPVSRVVVPASPQEAADMRRDAVSTMLYAKSMQKHAKMRKPLPPRLREVDDDTTIPAQVYNSMLQCGDQARGAFGYGQYKLQFTETGSVLRNRGIAGIP